MVYAGVAVASTFATVAAISSVPAWMVLPVLLTLSVNHANVVPTSIAQHSTMASALTHSERRRAFCLFFIVFAPLI